MTISTEVIEQPAADVVATGDTTEPVAEETPVAPVQAKPESSTDKALQKIQMEMANYRKLMARIEAQGNPDPGTLQRANAAMESLQNRMDAYNTNPGDFVVKEISALRTETAQMREELAQSRMESDRLKWQIKTGLTPEEQDQCLQQAASEAEDFTDPVEQRIAIQALYKVRMQDAAKLKAAKPVIKAAVKPVSSSAPTQGAARISANAAAVTPVSTTKPQASIFKD